MRVVSTLDRPRYPWKEIPGSSHQLLLSRILALPDGIAALDLGFGAGLLARRIRGRCRYLAGIELDAEAAREGAAYFDDPVVGDLVSGLGGPWRSPFDVVVAGDILEHLPQPEEALGRIRELIAPDGLLLASLPNAANVTVRLALLAGRFPYADRGILDRTHLRFYTLRSGRELLERSGFAVRRVRATAMPVELALPALGRPPFAGPVRAATTLLARLRPTLFGYQFVYEAGPA